MKPNTRSWVLFLQSRGTIDGLVVALGPWRSRVSAVRLRLLASGDLFEGYRTETGFELSFGPALGSGNSAWLLEVDHFEDAPFIRDIAWRSSDPTSESGFTCALPVELLIRSRLGGVGMTDAQQDVLRALFSEWLEAEGLPIGVRSHGAVLSARTSSPVDDLRARREGLAIERKAKTFFLALDAASMTRDLGVEWTAAMVHVNAKLGLRVDTRCTAGKSHEVPEWQSSNRLSRHLRIVSTVVKTLMTTHLYDETGNAVAGTFLLFATDRLNRVHPVPQTYVALKTHGAPNGEPFFRFVELAFACIDYQIDADFWELHLKELLLASHVYAEHGADIDHWGAPVYSYKENRCFPLQRIEKVAEQYKLPADVETREDQFGSLLEQALSPRESPPPWSTRGLKSAHRVKFVRQKTLLDPAAAASIAIQLGVFRALARAGA